MRTTITPVRTKEVENLLIDRIATLIQEINGLDEHNTYEFKNYSSTPFEDILGRKMYIHMPFIDQGNVNHKRRMRRLYKQHGMNGLYFYIDKLIRKYAYIPGVKSNEYKRLSSNELESLISLNLQFMHIRSIIESVDTRDSKTAIS